MADLNSIYTDPTTWRQSTVGGIKYRLVNRSGNFGFNRTDATETVLIKATDLQAFVREVLPLPTFLNNMPIWQATAMKGNLPLIAKNVSWSSHVDGLPIDPFGADTSAVTGTYHDIIKVEISYDDDPQSPGSGGGGDAKEDDPETFLEISCSAAGEFIRTESLNAYWFDDVGGDVTQNTTLELPNSVFVPLIEWNFTWPMLNYDFYKNTMVDRLRSANGRVNSSTFELLYSAPAETLLLTGWEHTEEHQMLFSSETSNPLYTHAPIRLTVKMLEKNVGPIQIRFGEQAGQNSPDKVTPDGDVVQEAPYVGHNHFWDKKEGRWRRYLTNGATGDSVYQSYDFNTLFTPASE